MNKTKFNRDKLTAHKHVLVTMKKINNFYWSIQISFEETKYYLNT